jgi:chemotaxis protein histidine kinase CheA
MTETQDQQEIDDTRAEILGSVVEEAREIIDHLNLCLIQLDQDLKDEALIDTITRGFHTMKGSSGFAGLDQLVTIAKAFEMGMREVKKETVSLTPSAVNLMYDGLDAITTILDKAEANDFTEIDATQLIDKVEKFKSGESMVADSTPEPDDVTETPSSEFNELLKIYRDGYNQLAALKHLMFSALHLEDPETLAVLLSKQIQENIGATRNSLWLIDPEAKIVETARNGKLVEKEDRRIFKSAGSEIFQRLLHEQLIYWPTDPAIFQEDLPEYESPVIFPIKIKMMVLGFLILDLKEKAEIELFQFITQFAALVMHISQLHRKVEEQREALDEMTGLLFKQNAHLSALHHIEMMLMQETDPAKQCQIVVDALVSDIDAVRAAAFIYYPSKKEFLCAAQSGDLENIVGSRYPLEQIKALQLVLESGRLVAHVDYDESLHIGSNQLDKWIALGIKGRKKIHGVLVVELGEEEFSDAISVIAQFLGVLLDDALLKQKNNRSDNG